MMINFHGKLLGAGLASIAIHVGMLTYWAHTEETAEIAGGAVTEIAMLGNDFENLIAAEDLLKPIEPTEITPDAEPLETPPIEPTPNEPQRLDTIEPVVDVVPSVQISPTVVPDALTPTRTPVIEEVEPVETARLTPAPLVRPPELREQRAEQPREALRPLPEKLKKAKPAPKKQKVQPKKKRVQKKTASETRQRGRTDGQTTGRSTERSTQSAKRAQKAGNKAVSNYPGKVQRRINRVRAKSVGGNGTARIRFVITANGRLASVSIAQSSGSSTVDQAAMDHVRRAAPFPKPPPGARLKYVVPIRVRG